MWFRSLFNAQTPRSTRAIARRRQPKTALRGRATCRLSLEQLESRDTPTSFFTYTEVDGDLVTITSSVGVVNGSNVTSGGYGKPCDTLSLGSDFAGANITFAVTQKPGGDGLANVGAIKAVGVDLGNVTVKGDLLTIDCGDGIPEHAALKSLNVRSMGRFASAIDDGDGFLRSNIMGTLGALRISGDLKGAYIKVTGGTIGSVTIGGSVIGGSQYASGVIYCTGDMGPVRIGGSLIGGAGISSGQVGSGAKTGSVTVSGSVVGGSGAYSGIVFGTTEIGPVKIGRDLVGGSAAQSGSVAYLGTAGKITSVSVGGSIVGGRGELSGAILAGLPDDGHGNADVGNVTVGGSVLGGGGKRSGFIYSDGALGMVRIGRDLHGGAGIISGYVAAVGKTTAIGIGGSLIGGTAVGAGAIAVADVKQMIAIGGSLVGGSGGWSGGITAANVGGISIAGDLTGGSLSDASEPAGTGFINVSNAKSLTIGGSMIARTDSNPNALAYSARIDAWSIGALTIRGSVVGNATHPASISLTGKPLNEAGFALGSLTVGGNVEWAVVESYSAVSQKNLQIGTVRVGGDWIASSITSDASWQGSILRIAAITIGGAIIGSVDDSSFAFTSHEIGAFRVGGRTIPRTTGIDPGVFFSWETGGDVVLSEFV